jgi:hypothetical protein
VDESFEDRILVNEGSADGLSWEIYTEGDEYFFTDRIPVILQFTYSSNFIDSFDTETLENESVWGDFRLHEIKRTGMNSFFMVMQPRQTGLSVFRVPPDLPFTAQFELQINSRLSSEETEPKALIEFESGFPYLVILILLLITALIITALFSMIKRKSAAAVSVEPGLKDLITSFSPDSDEDQCLAFYRNAFRLLLKELSELHPGVMMSDSPLELLNHLEAPSALNQWAVRALYPLLEDLDLCFFAPREGFQVNENLGNNLEILKGWIALEISGKEGDKA